MATTNNSNKLRVGVIGCGHLGKYHSRILAGLPETELSGVYDVCSAAALELAQKHGCPCFDTMADLLSRTDAVVVATPAGTHHSVVAEALKAGRHVLVEKPIADSAQAARELTQMAQTAGLVFCVGHVERFNPAFRQLMREQPNPRFIEAHRLAAFGPRGTDVDVILDLMIHDIDLVLRLVKSELKTLDASGAVVASKSLDIVNARLSFSDGCVANLTASRISGKKMRKFRVFQEGSYFSLDFSEPSIEMYSAPAGVTLQPGLSLAGADINIVYRRPELAECNPLEDEIQSFLNAIRNPGATGEVAFGRDGTAALEIAERIKECCKQ